MNAKPQERTGGSKRIWWLALKAKPSSEQLHMMPTIDVMNVVDHSCVLHWRLTLSAANTFLILYRYNYTWGLSNASDL